MKLALDEIFLTHMLFQWKMVPGLFDGVLDADLCQNSGGRLQGWISLAFPLSALGDFSPIVITVAEDELDEQ